MILQFPHKKRINEFGIPIPETKYAQKGQRIASADSLAQSLTSGCAPSAKVCDTMSIPLMLAVWQVELPATEKFILMALADYANGDSVCWPCMGTLAKKCGMSKATARRAAASLESKGLIYRDGRSGHANKYRIKVTPLKSGGVENKPRSNKASPRQNQAPYPAQNERQNLSPEPVKKQQDFSCEKKEAREVTPELREMLDKLYKGMKA